MSPILLPLREYLASSSCRLRFDLIVPCTYGDTCKPPSRDRACCLRHILSVAPCACAAWDIPPQLIPRTFRRCCRPNEASDEASKAKLVSSIAYSKVFLQKETPTALALRKWRTRLKCVCASVPSFRTSVHRLPHHRGPPLLPCGTRTWMRTCTRASSSSWKR